MWWRAGHQHIWVIRKPWFLKATSKMVMQSKHVYRALNFGPSSLSCLNGCWIFSFSLPPKDVCGHLLNTTLFLGDWLADATVAGLIVGFIDEFETTCFSYAIFLVALLSKVAPYPKAAVPTDVVIETHCSRNLAGLNEGSFVPRIESI